MHVIKWIGTLAAGVALGVGAVHVTRIAVEKPVSAPPTADMETHIVAPARTTPGGAGVSLAQILSIRSEFARNATLYDVLRSADADTIEALLEEAGDLRDGGAAFKETIYSRYVDLAPHAAVNHVLANAGKQQTLVLHVLSTWAESNLDGALAFAETFDEPLRTRAVLSAHARADPATAWDIAMAMQPGEVQTETLLDIAQRRFDQDAPTALDASTAISDPSQRATVQRTLLLRWAAMDRDAALNWTLSLPRQLDRTQLTLVVASHAATEVPREMLEVAATFDRDGRRSIAWTVLRVWARTDPGAAFAALQEMGDYGLTKNLDFDLFAKWTRVDPHAAFEWTLDQPSTSDRSVLLSHALIRVAASGEEAVELANDLEAGPREQAIKAAVSAWSQTDPRAAATWLDASPHRTDHNVGTVAGEYARLDPDEALDWALDQPVGLQRPAISSVFHVVTAKSPAAALPMLDRVPESLRDHAGSIVVSRWVEDDPRAAVRALEELEGDASQPLFETLFKRWSSFDAGAATAYLDRVPLSGRDAAAHGVLQGTLRGGNFDAAERVFDRIGDDGVRRRAAMALYSELRNTDEKRAERYRELSTPRSRRTHR